MRLNDVMLCEVSLLIDVPKLLSQRETLLSGFEGRMVVDISEHLFEVDIERLLGSDSVFIQNGLQHDFDRYMEVVDG